MENVHTHIMTLGIMMIHSPHALLVTGIVWMVDSQLTIYQTEILISIDMMEFTLDVDW